jgi:ribosome maturation factor RimP
MVSQLGRRGRGPRRPFLLGLSGRVKWTSRLVDLDALNAIIAPEADALGLALVRVAFFGGDSDPTLQVMAERPDTRQLTIDDCAELSRRISDRLDALEEQGRDPIDAAYRLEVSSPGIDRPLTRRADFADWAGHEAKIALKEKLDGRQRFQGDLQGIDADGVIMLTDRQGMDHRLPFDAIDSAKLVLTNKLIAATVPLSSDGADELEEEGQD